MTASFTTIPATSYALGATVAGTLTAVNIKSGGTLVCTTPTPALPAGFVYALVGFSTCVLSGTAPATASSATYTFSVTDGTTTVSTVTAAIAVGEFGYRSIAIW